MCLPCCCTNNTSSRLPISCSNAVLQCCQLIIHVETCKWQSLCVPPSLVWVAAAVVSMQLLFYMLNPAAVLYVAAPRCRQPAHLEAGSLAGTCLFLHWHDLHHLILQSTAQEVLHNLVLLDWHGEQVDLLQGLDLTLANIAQARKQVSEKRGRWLPNSSSILLRAQMHTQVAASDQKR